MPTRPAGGCRSPAATAGRAAWLWISVSGDAVSYLIDPSPSAKLAKSLFGDTACTVYVVCDRYSAYRKPARERGSKVILC